MTSRKTALLAITGALLVFPAFASADYHVDFNNVVTGGTPGGPTPWATLDGVQNGSDVDFTLTFNSFVGAGADTEFLKQLDLQYSGDLSGSAINESEAGITGTSIGSFVDAGISFDAMIDFETSNASGNRVLPGDTVSFTITNATADDFTFAMLHINGTPTGEDSGKVGPGPVPEPASMAALGMGALGLLARRRRAKK